MKAAHVEQNDQQVNDSAGQSTSYVTDPNNHSPEASVAVIHMSDEQAATMQWARDTYVYASTESEGYQESLGDGLCFEGQFWFASASRCWIVGGPSGIGTVSSADVGFGPSRGKGKTAYLGAGVIKGRGAYSSADYTGTYHGLTTIGSAGPYAASGTISQGTGCAGQLVSPIMVTFGTGRGAAVGLNEGRSRVSDSC